jgi:hypothetical protein
MFRPSYHVLDHSLLLTSTAGRSSGAMQIRGIERWRTALSYMDFVIGCHDSSFSTCPWLPWCVLWLILQPWYGTRMEECVRCPMKSFRVLLLEKLWWPLRWAQADINNTWEVDTLSGVNRTSRGPPRREPRTSCLERTSTLAKPTCKLMR